MTNFRIYYGPDKPVCGPEYEFADTLEDAQEIARDWSIDEDPGVIITIEDLRTGELTQVPATTLETW
jgi:hypothetical protein